MRSILLTCLLTACIPMAPASSTGPSSSSGGYAADPAAEPSPAADPAGAEPARAPSGPATVSVTIRSACSKTVSVFYGDKPKFSSGTTSSISSNSVQSKTFQDGDLMWVLDDRGEGAGSVTISSSTRNIEIGAGCNSISGR
ncbi:MAG TPA: hypothetical protein VIU61_23505 [Kofleriaceae bacterium]